MNHFGDAAAVDDYLVERRTVGWYRGSRHKPKLSPPTAVDNERSRCSYSGTAQNEKAHS